MSDYKTRIIKDNEILISHDDESGFLEIGIEGDNINESMREYQCIHLDVDEVKSIMLELQRFVNKHES